MSRSSEEAFESLLDFLRDDRGFDFTGYKRSTLGRRVRKRMAEVEVEEYDAYRRYLEAHPEEFTALFNTILINVTGFFRDPEAWEVLAREHLPALIARKRPSEPFRVWSAGCASGEETYTLAMVLAEALGLERFRDQVKIYATDADDEALAQARAAVYSARDLEPLSEELREKYFERAGGEYAFRADLRRLVIFGRHDLVRDAPISHLDLLVSRNTLMYFTSEIQSRIVNRFHFALNDGGVLFLGKAEMLRSHAALFSPLNLKARLFTKVSRTNFRERLLLMGHLPRPDSTEKLQRAVRLRASALDAHPAAQLVVDANGVVALANGAARALFGLAREDEGRPLQDLTVSYRPVELRSRIEQAQAERRPVVLHNVEYPLPDGDLHHFDVHVVPLSGDDRDALGVSIAFVDVTEYQRLQVELQETNQELETAFEELQSTNEELETTNEELQSTIEELETTNEELQSTNEELETMNEELQSTNEELETINDELQRRTGELNNVNAYMASILTSLRAAVVVVDRDLDIRVWNRKAEDLWGLRADEVDGHAFQNLDIGLPVERLKAPVRACIEGTSEYEEVILEAVNRRGRTIRCRVAATPFLGTNREIRGAVLVMEEWRDGVAADGGGAKTGDPEA
ncbi:MAG: PAS domain S-box protein [Gemmatimonadetes bacterium]|nr:PAS domain S-box protein [Gemmatimonadota bacterium]